MQTLNFKMKAGDLKGIVDLPNFDDEQLVNITVSPETEKNLSNEQIRYEKIMQKYNAFQRAEKNSMIMDEIQKIVGDDKVWTNEEEMIKYLAEMRRQNNIYANHA